MSIITISRASFSGGEEVAEKVAKNLGYDRISREILLDASEMFKIPEMKLARAINDAPSILDRFNNGKETYVTYIQAALLKYLREDNIVYHGLAGHFFVKDIKHVLKVRIIADMEDRVRTEIERMKISEEKAVKAIKKDDEQRRKWSHFLYGIDTWDSSLYDLILHIKNITTDDAADIICHTASLEHFKTSPESQKRIEDLALAAEVRAELFDLCPYVETTANDGIVSVTARVHEYQRSNISPELISKAERVNGVKGIKMTILPITVYTD
ncbi:MAG: cytidylate kinase-like family protein [Proteobacteria bacterium]|nr:cytidylate kinase-like family protein [Pseudomonadota bacterium]MBU4035531.1 cytidylate kinase-like family protein [Pseudomonadota bacterium]